jgi:hypothetical protein
MDCKSRSMKRTLLPRMKGIKTKNLLSFAYKTHKNITKSKFLSLIKGRRFIGKTRRKFLDK